MAVEAPNEEQFPIIISCLCLLFRIQYRLSGSQKSMKYFVSVFPKGQNLAQGGSETDKPITSLQLPLAPHLVQSIASMIPKRHSHTTHPRAFICTLNTPSEKNIHSHANVSSSSWLS